MFYKKILREKNLRVKKNGAGFSILVSLLVLSHIMLRGTDARPVYFEDKPQPIYDPAIEQRVLRGIDMVYNYEFDKADSIFNAAIKIRPDDPTGYFFKAMTQWERIISNFDDESQDDKLYEMLDGVIEMCDKRLDEDPEDITALFFKGGSVGFRGRLRANRGKWLAAANDGIVALPLVQKAYELEPENYDVLLGMGIYNYYAAVIPDRYPIVKPAMIFF